MPIVKILKTIFTTSLFSLTFNLCAHAEKAKPNLNGVKILVKDVGTVTFKHDDFGEPIGEPERLEVLITCLKAKTPKRLKLFRMCDVEEYTYESAVKTLHIKLAAGRVEPTTGEVHCDQIDDHHIDFTSVCASK